MNKFIGIGRLTKDPELRNTINGVAVCQFSLAVNRDYKNSNGEYETDFINCIAYRNSAELICKYTNKGDKLGIEGRLQVRNYEDKEGKKRIATEVIVEHIEFVESKKKEEKVEVKKETDPFSEFADSIELSQEELGW